MTAQESLPLGRDVAGVDEVGRGCLFGPVFAAAVVLEGSAADLPVEGWAHRQQKLSAKRRAALVPLIQALCVASGLGQASAREIDACGIRVATERAMLRALQRLPQSPGLVLVDGNLPLRLWQGPQHTVIAGDSRSAAIAAASVLAKEARDALIRRLSARFPGYGLERHAGYGTAQHRQSLMASGPTPLHRHTFLKRLLG